MIARWRRTAIFIAFLLLAALGCGSILAASDDSPLANDAGASLASDASGSQPAACNLAAPFGEPRALTELNITIQQDSPRLMPDELTIYFNAITITIAGDSGVPSLHIFVATRKSLTD